MITPLPGRILLRPLPRPRRSATIETPALDELAEQETPQPAEVLALGPCNRDTRGRTIPWNVAVGDTVLVTPYMGAEVFQPQSHPMIAHADEKLWIMREDAVLGVIPKGDQP